MAIATSGEEVFITVHKVFPHEILWSKNCVHQSTFAKVTTKHQVCVVSVASERNQHCGGKVSSKPKRLSQGGVLGRGGNW